MTDDSQTEANEPASEPELNEPTPSNGPDTTPASEETAEIAPQVASEGVDEVKEETEPRPPLKLERLQKILARAGVASRRSAEEMITAGRVQVNGKVVTELGTKADGARDHIRVDGKLLHGSERLRYFMLNKPRGYVTTVKDPEGRRTVMEFFAKMSERLYPVGRLDYLSEGLLVVTNDGELANQLTKAASGVEKTYLVKVSGQPTESELEILRGGVSIERGKAGEGRVRTAPARIRQVRQGDNPWYEVVLIEGRNRELRKMFEEVGHFVEKIRRVGYGPLVLDVEPGDLRELTPDELAGLRRAAEGKLRTPKAKDVRRRNVLDAQLPTMAPRPSRPRPVKPAEVRPPAEGAGDFRPQRAFGANKPFRSARPTGQDSRSPAGRPTGKPTDRPAWKKDDRPARPAARPEWKRDAGSGRSYGAKPAWKKPGGGDRPDFRRPAAPPRNAPDPTEGDIRKKPTGLRIDPIEPEQPGTSRPGSARPPYSRPATGRPSTERPRFERATSARPRPERPVSARPRFDRPKFDRPRPAGSDERHSGGPGRTGAGTYGAARPPRGEAGLGRPFTTSTGKPRAGGARPSSKPGKPAGRSYGAGAAEGAGHRPAGKTGWKPKPNFKGKPGGAKRTGPRPGGKRPGGKKRS
jgi:23S rRNA pseudouridine2605 synthase